MITPILPGAAIGVPGVAAAAGVLIGMFISSFTVVTFSSGICTPTR